LENYFNGLKINGLMDWKDWKGNQDEKRKYDRGGSAAHAAASVCPAYADLCIRISL
jgi:hypothetical protein